jgi:23S rRNA (uridine2552-2'-O)-methyltransferase
VLEFSCYHLSTEGSVLIKTFQSSGFSQLVEKYKHKFSSVKVKKPKSSKSDSSEIFLVARNLK